MNHGVLISILVWYISDHGRGSIGSGWLQQHWQQGWCRGDVEGGENGRRLRAGVAAAADLATAALVIAITLAAVTAAPRRCSDGGLATQAAVRRQQRVCGNSGEEVEEGSCCCHCCGCANGWKHARRANGNNSSFWDSFTPDLPRPCQGCSVPHCAPEDRWCGRTPFQ